MDKHAYILNALEANNVPLPVAELMADMLITMQTGNNSYGIDELIESALELWQLEGDKALDILKQKLAQIIDEN